MDAFLTDLRGALRGLRSRPGLALAAVLTLGFAIGANTAIFSVVEAVLLHALPYADPERVAVAWVERSDGDRESVSIPDFVDLRAGGSSLEAMGGMQLLGMNLTGEGDPQRVMAARISDGWLAALGVRPQFGRPFTAAELQEGAQVAILTNALGRQLFGSEATALGRTVVLADESYEVVGVLDPGFVFPNRTGDLLVPLSLTRDPRASRRDAAFLRVVARLRPRISLESAAAQATATLRELARLYPAENGRKRSVLLVPVADELVGQYRAMLFLLLGAVGLVLLIGCANLVGLMLAQAAARRHEFAVRSALGAARGRLLQQVLIESVLLSLLGGLLGVFIAAHLTRFLIAVAPQQIPRIAESGVSIPVLAFALLLSVGSGLLSGLFPAFHASLANPAEGLGDGRTSPGPASARVRRLLVGAEVALSVVLLSLAGLLSRSFERLHRIDPGFEAAHALTARLSLPPSRYKDAASLARFAADVRARVRVLPGVVEVGTCHALPLAGVLSTVDFTVEGRPPPRREEIPQLHYRMASPGLLRALGVPLKAGRELDDRDRAEAPGVVIVNQRMAEALFPGESAVGKRLRLDDLAPQPRLVEIVGVAGDTANASLEEPRGFHAYVPLAQVPAGAVTYARNVFLVVRTAGDPLLAAPSVLRELRALDSLLPASSVRSMEQAVEAVLAPRRFSLTLVQLFGVSALFLAALGVYALTAHAVAQRKREMGIRLALGAAPGGLVGATILQAMRPAAIGLLAGAVAAVVAGRLAAGMLYQVSPGDPLSLTLAVGVLAAAAAVAAWVPARRVARVDPVDALRAQ